MANIVTISDFANDLNLPERTQTGPGENLTDFINQYEPEFLRLVLGYDFYVLFAAGLAGTPVARMVTLKNGTAYIDQQDIKRSYDGIKPAIAQYIYWQYLKYMRSSLTAGTGEVKTKTENAEPVSQVNKQVWAWNSMIDTVKAMYGFLYAEAATYPEFDLAQVTPLFKQNALNL